MTRLVCALTHTHTHAYDRKRNREKKKDERRTRNIIRNRVKITHQKAGETDASRSYGGCARTYAHTH